MPNQSSGLATNLLGVKVQWSSSTAAKPPLEGYVVVVYISNGVPKLAVADQDREIHIVSIEKATMASIEDAWRKKS